MALKMDSIAVGGSLFGMALASVVGLGCAAPQTDPDLDPTFRGPTLSAGSGDWNCRRCGFTNSPYMGVFPVNTLYFGDKEAGVAVPRVAAIASPSGATYDVRVDEDGLVAEVGGQSVSGDALVGWSLLLKHGNNQYEIDIYNYREVDDWTDHGGQISTYGLSYVAANGEGDFNVCPGMNLDETSVVFLVGETYDFDHHEVQPDQEGFATLACRGHALAKMKLLGYDPRSSQYQSSPEQRQATIRMLTADYCGNGDSNTISGQPLGWTDAAGHVQFDGGSDIIEALWDESGATCLNTPRYMPASAITCGLPSCDPTFAGHQAEDWVSLHP